MIFSSPGYCPGWTVIGNSVCVCVCVCVCVWTHFAQLTDKMDPNGFHDDAHVNNNNKKFTILDFWENGKKKNCLIFFSPSIRRGLKKSQSLDFDQHPPPHPLFSHLMVICLPKQPKMHQMHKNTLYSGEWFLYIFKACWRAWGGLIGVNL